MHFIHANRAILFEFLCNTNMIIFLAQAKATATYIAMKEVFSSPYSTYSTSITMKNLFFFVFIIEKIAHTAEIPRKFDLTIFTILLWSLDMFTVLTANLYYFMTVYLVIFFGVHFVFKLCNIMAKPAREKF